MSRNEPQTLDGKPACRKKKKRERERERENERGHGFRVCVSQVLRRGCIVLFVGGRGYA